MTPERTELMEPEQMNPSKLLIRIRNQIGGTYYGASITDALLTDCANVIAALQFEVIDADAAMMHEGDRVDELTGLLRRLDWPNIHTHYGLTTSCGDCQIYLSIDPSDPLR